MSTFTALLATAALMGDVPAPAALLEKFKSEFVEVQPGKTRLEGKNEATLSAEFSMGGDKAGPVHKVGMARPFRIAKYEVTQELYQAVMGHNPSKWKGPRNSVEMVSFDDAVEFCRQATEQMRKAGLIAHDEVVRLPSEAEWEYAARAGTTTRYSFGDDADSLGEYAWFMDNAKGNDPPVGAKKPNALDLYDVHGYLWEWCADPWHADYVGAPADGSTWSDRGDDARRVLRGGSWKDTAPDLTSAFRRAAPRETKDDAVGLRCVLEKGPAP